MDELKLTDSEVKQVLGNQELKEIIMPFGIVTKRNSVDFVCCNCREEIRINENIKGFNCPNCDAIFRKNEDGGYIEQWKNKFICF